MVRQLEEKVQHMYESAPYPDLGSDLKDDMSRYWPHIPSVVSRNEVNYLDAGCGTGHILVASAKAKEAEVLLTKCLYSAFWSETALLRLKL